MMSIGSMTSTNYNMWATAGTTTSAKMGGGLSQTMMQAMISADSSMKLAKTQDITTAQMEGKSRVLESEIETDKSRGMNTEDKEAELADLQERIESASASQISTLADASKGMEDAAKTDQTTETAGNKNNKTEDTALAGKVTESTAGSANTQTAAPSAKDAVAAKTPVAETVWTVSQPTRHTRIDILA